MVYRYRLKSHSDIGYNKFFDQFRAEYDEVFMNGTMDQWREMIDRYLGEYRCRVDWVADDGTLIFERECDFTWFVLRWSDEIF